jgi:Tol biopolymer transport system component
MCTREHIGTRRQGRRQASVASLLLVLDVPQSCRILLLACFAMLIVACGGGGGGSNLQAPTAPTNPIVYIAANSTGTFELFLVDGDSPGVATKINPPLVAGGNVGAYALSPDLTHVAYLAFQESATVPGLYLVDLATPGTSTRLNSALVANGGIDEFAFSPDGARIAYIADQDVAGKSELYLVVLANPGVSTKLNSALGADRDVAPGHSFSPDGTKVLYAADQEVDGRFELYLVDLAALGISTKVNEPFVAGGNTATGYRFSPDGEWIGYLADQDVDDLRELYLVATATPGVSSKLNATLGADRDVCAFEFSPDSTLVAYCADQDVDDIIELYLVDITVPGVATQLNPPLVAGGEVSAQSYRFSPDSSFVVYRADQDTDEVFELYRVDVTTPGTSEKINGALTAGGDIPTANRTPAFRISPDSSTVTYIADQDTDNRSELYAVDLATPGTSQKLNPPVQSFGIAQIDMTVDGSQVVYHALQDSATVPELYRVALASPGTSTKINGALAANGAVIDFSITPGLRTP